MCQRADWKYHKYLCRQYQNFKERPDSESVRAILFPDDDESPRFVWVKMNSTILDLDNLDKKLEVARLLGVVTVDQRIGQQEVFRSNRRAAKTAASTAAKIQLLLQEDSFVNGSMPNMSIATNTQGKFAFSWRGPVVAVLVSVEDSTDSNANPVIDDMTMIDYRDLVDFFRTYGQYEEGEEDFGPTSFWWLAPALKEEMIAKPQIQVIRISSDVEQDLTRNKYNAFSIGKGHPAMAFLRPLPVTASLGMPIVMQRYPTAAAIKAEIEVCGNSRNTGPGLLLTCIDPKSENWGKQGLVHGDVVAMRYDEEDLHPHHVQGMSFYMASVVLPAMAETLEQVPKRQRGEVLEMLHPSRFDWFFKQYRKEKMEDDETWMYTPNLFYRPPRDTDSEKPETSTTD